jgi:predicted transporter
MNLIDNIKIKMEKFNFSQMTSNSDGKTSGSGVAGLYIIFLAGILLAAAVTVSLKTKDAAFLSQYTTIITVLSGVIVTGSGLLLGRKIKDADLAKDIANKPEETEPKG